MNRPSTVQWFVACLILLLAAQLVHFTRLNEFGLWEDDYWSIAPNLGKPADGLGSLLVYYMKTWPTGRPLNHFLPTALSIIGSKLGGLGGIYTVAMVWLGLNACLVFAILGRLMPLPGAFTGALVYLLFPADTTKILLVHAAHIQGAMTFLLAGLLAWLHGGVWRWVGYAVAACSLMAYETAFLPFLAAPLLTVGDRRSTLRTWAVHLTLAAACIGLVAFIRLKTGDVRAVAALGSTTETIHRAATSLYLGPATSAWAFVKGAIGGWQHLNAFAAASGSLLVGAIVGCLMMAPQAGDKSRDTTNVTVWPGWLDRARSPEEKLPWWWLALGGVIVWCGCYVLTLVNYPPTQLMGRFTSTHIAAAWPVALVAAALATRAARLRPLTRRLALGIALLGAFLLTSYHHFIQKEYIRAWREEQRFWREVMELAPDAGPGWTVIATGPATPVTPVIASNSWADYHACRLIFDPTAPDATVNFAHLGHIGPFVKFENHDGAISWQPQFWQGGQIPIDPHRLVLLDGDGARLWRVQEISTSAGPLRSLAPVPPRGRSGWPDTPVAHLLFPDQYR
jgi:hypothetical protein